MQKLNAAKTRLAESLINKVNQPLSALTATLARPHILLLPASIKTTGETILSELADIHKMCKMVVEDPSSDIELLTIKELTTKIGHAKKFDALLSGMAASVAQR